MWAGLKRRWTGTTVNSGTFERNNKLAILIKTYSNSHQHCILPKNKAEFLEFLSVSWFKENVPTFATFVIYFTVTTNEQFLISFFPVFFIYCVTYITNK